MEKSEEKILGLSAKENMEEAGISELINVMEANGRPREFQQENKILFRNVPARQLEVLKLKIAEYEKMQNALPNRSTKHR